MDWSAKPEQAMSFLREGEEEELKLQDVEKLALYRLAEPDTAAEEAKRELSRTALDDGCGTRPARFREHIKRWEAGGKVASRERPGRGAGTYYRITPGDGYSRYENMAGPMR